MQQDLATLLSAGTFIFFFTAACCIAAVFDTHGRMTALEDDGHQIPLMIDLRIPPRGGDTRPGLAQATETETITREGRIVQRGVIQPDDTCSYAYEIHVHKENGATLIEVRVTAGRAGDIDGIFVEIDLPYDEMVGGYVRAYRGDEPTGEVWSTFPRPTPVTDHHHTQSRQWMLLRDFHTDRLIISSADESRQIEAEWDRQIPVFIEDMRREGIKNYSCRLLLADGVDEGETASLRLAVSGRVQPAREQVHLQIDTDSVGYRLDGVGGNYCFNTRTPDTDYTLEHLRSGWARTEMTLQQWVPDEGYAGADNTDWDYLREQDRPGSELRREFELMQILQQRDIPFVVSVWHLPEWLYEDDEILGRGAHRRRIHPDKWPDLLEAIASYLVYARDEYGVEPELFSFNEPNAGVRVLLTPEEHRDQIKMLGAYLAARGLSTRMLLGDVIHVGHHEYIEPAMNDPEAMQFVGGIGFHSWGRIDRPAYQRWAGLAEELDLPLLVSEKGVDANAWRDRSFNYFAYALLELRTYMELLLHARPQGIMYWEFTRDYSLLKTVSDASGGRRLERTPRFYFTKHFTNLTPQPAEALATASDMPGVMFVAFRGMEDESDDLIMHIANLGAAGRNIVLSGLPQGVGTLTGYVSGEKRGLAEYGPVAVTNGTAEFVLPAEALLTLSALPAN